MFLVVPIRAFESTVLVSVDDWKYVSFLGASGISFFFLTALLRFHAAPSGRDPPFYTRPFD